MSAASMARCTSPGRSALARCGRSQGNASTGRRTSTQRYEQRDPSTHWRCIARVRAFRLTTPACLLLVQSLVVLVGVQRALTAVKRTMRRVSTVANKQHNDTTYDQTNTQTTTPSNNAHYYERIACHCELTTHIDRLVESTSPSRRDVASRGEQVQYR